MTECFCSRCAPSTAALVCSRCGEEIRHGWRHGIEGFWHRVDVDHAAVLGHTITMSDQEAIEAALDAPRIDANGEPYTTREYDLQRMKKAAREAIEAEDEDFVATEIPPPEVTAEPVEKTSQWVPSGAKQIWNLAEKNGWTIIKATRSRGPRVHSSLGTLLSISDYFLLKIRLDGSDRAAVASWCDGKFSFAYNVTIHRKTRTLTADKANSDGLKAWIKGE